MDHVPRSRWVAVGQLPKLTVRGSEARALVRLMSLPWRTRAGDRPHQLIQDLTAMESDARSWPNSSDAWLPAARAIHVQ